jgi:predicted peptidase
MFLSPLACALVLLTAQSAPAAPAGAAGFLYKTLEIAGESYAYTVYLPPDYTPERRWPVVLFLHGSGERGSDGFLSSEVGLGSAIRRDYRRAPAIVVFPQCRPGQLWAASPTDVGPMGRLALACLDRTQAEYSTDPDRVYLTGLSLGGHGAWRLAAAEPQRWAAAAPICGFLEDPSAASRGIAAVVERIKGLPLWVVHGDKDTAVPADRSREIVAALRAADAPVHYVELKDVGHNAWDKAYADPEFWKWLLAQRRGAATRPAP